MPDNQLRLAAPKNTRHGKRRVIIVSAKEWERQARRKENLVEFLAKSPLKRSGLEIERLRNRPRDIER